MSDRQHTLAKPASLTGTSLHTGEQVTLTLQPAPENFGIQFRRMDVEDQPLIPALAEKVQKVERATTIAEGSVKVHTVEHVLSALTAMGVDNAIVEMDANEPPIAIEPTIGNNAASDVHAPPAGIALEPPAHLARTRHALGPGSLGIGRRKSLAGLHQISQSPELLPLRSSCLRTRERCARAVEHGQWFGRRYLGGKHRGAVPQR